jgi:hypothetical protein
MVQSKVSPTLLERTVRRARALAAQEITDLRGSYEDLQARNERLRSEFVFRHSRVWELSRDLRSLTDKNGALLNEMVRLVKAGQKEESAVIGSFPSGGTVMAMRCVR